ncbi:MAG: DUF1722 domain-containing protein, partial [Candidatus Omnitrophica bacterium]|nr:DUF1722 domain-containing protein [Candidatus Omnitrophota bacterium]
PVEEDGRLHDARLRENFIERIFVMHRWHELNAKRKTLSSLMHFHARHKYVLMAHCPATLKELGTMLAQGKPRAPAELHRAYFERFIGALAKIATIKKNTNVLHHLMGYFKQNLDKEEKTELKDLIAGYHAELLPLIVPVTLVNHYARKYKPLYLRDQIYLQPHPLELMLRNHV